MWHYWVNLCQSNREKLCRYIIPNLQTEANAQINTLSKKARLCYKYELTLIYHNAACNHWLLALKHSSVAVFSFSFFLAFFFLTFFWFNLVCCFSFKNQFWLSKLDLKLHWRYYYRLHLRSHCVVPSESKGRQNVRLGDHSYIT